MNIEDHNIESIVEMRISGTTLDGEPVNVVFPAVDADKAIIRLGTDDCSTFKKKAIMAFDYDDIIFNKGEECDLCRKYDLEDGDTLYISSDWDGGVGFDYIRDIHFCPKCGRKLK